MSKFFACCLLLVSTVVSAADKPVIHTILYKIEGNRSTKCSAVAVGPKLLLSCDHAVRDERCNLGRLLVVDRKYDRVLIELDQPVTQWSSIRETPLKTGETVYFDNGNTARVAANGELKVNGRMPVDGMSGGPIWDAEGRVVSVISEGEPGNGTLWGYPGLAAWVAQHTPAQAQQQPTGEPQDALQALRARAAELLAGAAQQGPQKALRLEYYSAGWCGPCRRIGEPALAQLGPVEGLTVEQYDVDTAKGSELGQQRKVTSVPTYILFDGDKEIARQVGAMNLAALKDFLEEGKQQPEPQLNGELKPFIRTFVNGRANGSAVIVAEQDDRWIAITARHVIGTSNNVKLEIGEELRTATVINRSGQAADAAVLTVERKSELITPIPIAEKGPGVGVTVDTHGYPRADKYDPKTAKVINDEPYTDVISGYFIGGVSGGAVTYDGEVVGIFSTSNRATSARIIDAETLTQFLTASFLKQAEPELDGENPPEGYHSHKCRNCGTVWVHKPGREASHNCPQCGQQQLQIYRQGRRAA